jgi:MFS family permease
MDSSKPSSWAPLKNRVFLVLWLATLFSNIGTWMNDVGAGWLMTSLSLSPSMIAAIQAMTTLPVFLLALPAGAIADIFDKRKLLIIVNLLMLCAATLLAVLVYFNLATVGWLLLITFILGSGAAFLGPAWQAIVPSIIGKDQLKAGIALNSMGINISRAIGPALAGVLISQIGLYLPFVLNALSFIAIISAIWWWKGEKKTSSTLPAESVIAAMISGVRYARYSPALLKTILRAASFFIFASAYWAMLPLIARQSLQGDATLYGLLTTSIGVGAVCGAFSLSALRSRFSANTLVTIGTFGTVAVLLIFALAQFKSLAIIASALAGFSWIITLSTLMVSAQTALPNWVRARGLALYLTAFSGSMAFGSFLWGQVASYTDISTALVVAAVGSIIVWAMVLRVKINQEDLDLQASDHLHEPTMDGEVTDFDNGPVLITVTYRLEKENRDAFLTLVHQLKTIRLRDGGYSWGIFSDPSDANGYLETFLVTSWAEHMRQHKRATNDDNKVQQQIDRLITDKKVSHYLPAATVNAVNR